MCPTVVRSPHAPAAHRLIRNAEFVFTLTTKTADGTETLLVATQGEPYLLKATNTGKDVIDADDLG